jgi:hypothetical protein
VALTSKWDCSGALSISGARAATLCILIVTRSQVVDQRRRSDAHNFFLRQLESDKDARAAAIMPRALAPLLDSIRRYLCRAGFPLRNSLARDRCRAVRPAGTIDAHPREPSQDN